MGESSIWIPLASMNQHSRFIVGATGKGRSYFLQQCANQEGISYEKMLARDIKLKEEQQIKLKREQQMKDAKRLQMVRNAYWDASSEDEFYCIHDSISEFCGINPSKEQVKCVFDTLPAGIIGSGIKWGFDDTDVRDNIYDYIRSNAIKMWNLINRHNGTILEK